MAGLDKFNFSKKPAKKGFQDSGPPAMTENESRGSSGGTADDDGMVMASDVGGAEGDSGASDGGGDVYGQTEDAAADTLGDLCGVSPDDRNDFKDALKAYVAACVQKQMGGDSSGGEPAMDSSEEG